ncbi:NAD(P)-dependent glycerol-3-phosphate dehydrogenase [Roseomonas terrae]|jgi:glycerol-3-phosphate dehydrogenase (NAD(P)+)|uniref:Glycerol-3-phosphate dehydrogenase [NAD(P)+] n=1 Tax=Neoroseomonas terrae TaxID=424799 RepID=A0ABS5ENT8_9PROT|nr:NAD(P)H-dependent glycerol-3-phosphate dehydrogenase [Neoroseomonas terrae]MBR0652672.1 NAD(P)-dependent glycerol-3-phosphate dehydrogenase [Neoroseomonas terrae]
MTAKTAILGAGAWGTALAIQAARAGCDVALWARDTARAEAIAAARVNQRYLPGIALPDAVKVTADAEEALGGAALALMVVPAQALARVLAAMPVRGVPLLACCKGVEASTLRLPLEIIEAIRPGLSAGVLSGPNFAHEVARGLPAAAVVAAADPALREAGLALLSSPAFRLYGGEDPIGAEVGGAAKNVIAIAAGAVIGAGLGENARAALVTRGLAELSRLAVALGGRAETAAGLTGLGDLMLTCAGPGSRNMSLGLALGRGESLAAVLAGRAGVTEGVATAPAIVARAAAAGVELPICEAVADLVAERITVPEAMARLLARPQRAE